MKIKAVSGYTCHIKNLNKAVQFYETLGFENRKQDANHATLYSNWFWIVCLTIGKDERTESTKGADLSAGISIYLSVDSEMNFIRICSPKDSSRRPSRRINPGATVNSSCAILMGIIW